MRVRSTISFGSGSRCTGQARPPDSVCIPALVLLLFSLLETSCSRRGVDPAAFMAANFEAQPAASMALDANTKPAATATVAVDFSVPRRRVTNLYRLGINLWGAQEGDAALILRDQKIGNLRDNRLSYATKNAGSLEEVRRALPRFGEAYAKIRRLGGQVTVLIQGTPKYLRSCPGERLKAWDLSPCPPADLKAWGMYVEEIVRFLNVERGLDLRYEIWNEPDAENFFRGSWEQYFAVYHASAEGARRADAKARIGGPAAVKFNAGSKSVPRNMNDGFIREFIRYCGKMPVSTPQGKLPRTPIDFLSWHQYEVVPHWAGFWLPHARRFLEEAGYSSTELIIDEWNAVYWGDILDSQYAASNAVANILAFEVAGLDDHAFFALGDRNPAKGEEEFSKSLGILTKGRVKKPVYNAFRMLGLLSGRLAQVEVESDSPFLDARAFVDDASVSVLLVNHVPELKRAVSNAVAFSTKRVSTLKEIKGLKGRVDSQEFFLGPRDPRDPSLGLSEEAVALALTARAAARENRTFRRLPLRVTVEVAQLGDPSLSEESLYVLDSRRSNSFAAYRRAIKNGGNAREALDAARAAAELIPKKTTRREAGSSLKRTVTMEPNSVVVLRWVRPAGN